ncbi:thiamine phosphate synthase [Pelagibacteraceae bacterium]|nr:thiamine phosphate synthase [Pelagibacteraceae bacterium]
MKRLVYLISPNKIDKNFYKNLDAVLSYGNVKFFQLRLKKIKKKELLKISNKIKKISIKHKVKFIINDDVILALKTNADGCHMGQLDGSIKNAKKKLRDKILGVTCHSSKILAKKAVENKANYLAFGSFFNSKLKPNAKKASINILKWSRKNIKKPIVVIGGINNLNYKVLLKAGAKYIAISSFIWDNPKLKPEIAIKKFK